MVDLGGALAIEMAEQLRHVGREVPLVVMLEINFGAGSDLCRHRISAKPRGWSTRQTCSC